MSTPQSAIADVFGRICVTSVLYKSTHSQISTYHSAILHDFGSECCRCTAAIYVEVPLIPEFPVSRYEG